MDEPTSALTDRETRRLFGIIAALKAEGRAIIYIRTGSRRSLRSATG